MISIAKPILGDEEKKVVAEVLNSGGLAQGPKVLELERLFASYCGTKYAVALNSGTAAIHTALHATGITTDDEVITTPFTFIATVNPILMQSARPVFVDINEDTFNIDSELVEKAVNGKTKTILAVDLYGQPFDYDEINQICRAHKLKLIEDSCQSIGSQYKNKKAGSLGDVGCFSLYATKNIMSGEGGVLTTDNSDIVEKAKRFRQHGMTGPYEYDGLGYNYRMTDVLAAIAIEQIKKADTFINARIKNAQALNEGLSSIEGIITPKLASYRSHVYHQYTIRITESYKHSRDNLANILKREGIGSGVYYPKPLHYYSHIAALGYQKGDFPIAEKISQQVLSLPVHPGISVDDIARIVEVIKSNSL